MGTVKNHPRDRFNTLKGVLTHFQRQKWPMPPQAINQRAFIVAQAQHWTEEHPEAVFNKDIRTFPTAKDLFELAADADYGPYAQLRGLRFRVSRLMARRLPEDLGPTIRAFNGKTYANVKTLASSIVQIECGQVAGEASLVTALANAYGVELNWLNGVVPESGSIQSLAHLVHRSQGYGPAWLRPWHSVLTIAVEACQVLQRDQVSTDLLLSDPSYCGEFLERFFELRSKDMAHKSGKWSQLLYFPLTHAAMVAARERTLSTIPSWML